MPLYGTSKPPALAPGQQYVLSSASLGSGSNLTQAVAPAQVPGNPSNLTIVNNSAVSLTVEVAATDVAANYVPLSGVTVPANTAVSFSTTAPFVAVLPASDPGTGVITICR
jgi:hypothetical protein